MRVRHVTFQNSPAGASLSPQNGYFAARSECLPRANREHSPDPADLQRTAMRRIRRTAARPRRAAAVSNHSDEISPMHATIPWRP